MKRYASVIGREINKLKRSLVEMQHLDLEEEVQHTIIQLQNINEYLTNSLNKEKFKRRNQK